MTTKDMKARIKELRELEAKATPGPWKFANTSWCSGAQSLLRTIAGRRTVQHGIGNYDDDSDPPWEDFAIKDQALIVPLRNNASWLLDLAASALDDQEDLRAAVKTLRAALKEARREALRSDRYWSGQIDVDEALEATAKYEETT